MTLPLGLKIVEFSCRFLWALLGFGRHICFLIKVTKYLFIDNDFMSYFHASKKLRIIIVVEKAWLLNESKHTEQGLERFPHLRPPILGPPSQTSDRYERGVIWYVGFWYGRSGSQIVCWGLIWGVWYGRARSNPISDGRRKLNMQKFSVEGTVHFQNLKFLNAGDQMKEMQREGQ